MTDKNSDLPSDGDERLYIDENHGQHRIVLEQYSESAGWLYQNALVVDDPATLDALRPVLEDKTSTGTDK